MSRAVSHRRDISALARQHLNDTKSDQVTLIFYINELRTYLDQLGDNTNFRIIPEPGTGYGKAICQEPECQGVSIALTPRPGSRDGGIREGLGSLQPYVVHAATHPQRGALRRSQEQASYVKVEADVQRADRKKPVQKDVLRETASLSSPIPPSSVPRTHTAALHSRAVVKAEPEEHALSRKRRSSVALNYLKSGENLYPSLDGLEAPSKIVKLEHREDVKVPLAEANRPRLQPTASAIPAQMDAAQVDDAREQLQDVQDALRRAKTELMRAEGKRKKTKGDLTRIARLMKERDELEAEKRTINASLPVLYRPQSTTAVQLPRPFYNPGFVHPPVLSDAPVVTVTHHAQTAAPESTVKPEGFAEQIRFSDSSDDSDGENFNNGVLFKPGINYARAVGKADDIDKFLIEAGNAELFDENANVNDCLRKLGLRNLYQPLRGMEIALMAHQVIGVSWMLERENNANFNGGILADDMGLGKTVQMIALMIKNKPTNPIRKSTLIVAPLALLDQWQLEIESKTDIGLRCLIYHGNNKARNLDELQQYDVVLTTFHTLALELPDAELDKKKVNKRKRKYEGDDFIVDDSDEDEGLIRKRRVRLTPGLLFQAHWYLQPKFYRGSHFTQIINRYRVVLDEAQYVRNRATRASVAVCKLDSQYRWCLTGTPITNGLADAYSLIRFLKTRPWYDWHEFNRHVVIHEKRNPSLASGRLQVIFKPILLRRKKDSLLDGEPLVKLPSKTVELCMLEFTQEERDIYKMVETKSQAIFNRYLRAGTVLKNYYQVLVLLLRLRQVCSHPSLITEDAFAYIRPGEEADISNRNAELLRAHEVCGSSFVERVRDKYRLVALQHMAAEKESADATHEVEECSICLDNFTDPVVTNCEHVYCKECILNAIRNAPRDNGADPAKPTENVPKCPTCRASITEKCLFSRAVFEPTEAELTGEKPPVPTYKLKKTKPAPRSSARKRATPPGAFLLSDEEESEDEADEDDLSDFIVQSDEEEEEKDARRFVKKRLHKGKRPARRIIIDSDDEYDDDIIHGAMPDIEATPEEIALMPRFLPSTKMKFMMELIRKCAEERPDEKILVISQWTQCLSLVSDFLAEHGFLHVKYQGDMSRNKRDQAVKVLMSKDKASIMLMSLKCGGVGLNLTRANNVISLDLAWSLAVEQQAYDRVHRLGQTRSVHVQRLVISNTVEDRILALQERKKNLADGSLGEGGGKKIGRLSVKELANLFGLNAHGQVLEE